VGPNQPVLGYYPSFVDDGVKRPAEGFFAGLRDEEGPSVDFLIMFTGLLVLLMLFVVVLVVVARR